jgi:taurine dioxygenase
MEIVATDCALGADVVDIDLSQPPDADTTARLRAAFDEHAVLRFRDQHLTIEQLHAFGGAFGPLDITDEGAYGGRHDLENHPNLMIISNVVEDGIAVGALGDGELKWHSDMSNWSVPPWATMLYAVEVPEAGGDTSFSSMYAALDSLPANLREHIDGRIAMSDGTYDSTGSPNTHPVSSEHPMVARHPFSDRDMLYLGRRWNGYVVDMPTDESDGLLDTLWDHGTEDRFTWTHSWRVGDLIMWDNLATLHRRTAFVQSSRRVMWRLQLTGQPINPVT